MNTNPVVGQYELIINDLINSNNPGKIFLPNQKNINFNQNNNKNLVNNNIPIPNGILGGSSNKSNEDDDLNQYQKQKLKELENHIDTFSKKFISNDYNDKIMKNYIDWINKVRLYLTKRINNKTLYNFFSFDANNYNFTEMSDYWDVPDTEKLFSFSLFISDTNNLTYLIGLVYNYAIMRKHFSSYIMRIYIDFHSVFGSAETFNLLNMFTDILKEIDPTYMEHMQFIVFFLNPFYSVGNESIYDNIVMDIDKVIEYYTSILYNTASTYIKSPLLDFSLEKENVNSEEGKKDIKTETNKNTINIDNMEINYNNIDKTTARSTFALFSTHIAVNLRFLPLNENCEFHVRDLDSRLSQTDINIINKFNNPKFSYVPFYVFQFYKFYFPYLKWRIDVNPYLAGCFGGNNRKNVTISKELENTEACKILKREIFFKYILFISFNATNLQIGFLNDEFILANIFERIKGKFSENILYLNLGSFANKHVNEYYYGISNSQNYPCMLKLGIPIDILRYPLNGKYLTVDPITDFKIGIIPLKYHNDIKLLITEQIKIFMGSTKQEVFGLANRIRKNYKFRLDDEIKDDLEAALFFSMVPVSYTVNAIAEFNLENYTENSYKNQFFSSVGNSTMLVKNERLKATNFLLAGYLLADVLEDIIFPKNPQYINSNYYLSSDNYDRLFNCLYFDETKKTFIQRKINKNDVSRKYADQSIIDHIPEKFIEFKDKTEIKNILNTEFNDYLVTCQYKPSMFSYIQNIPYTNFIQVQNRLIKSGILLFIKNYAEPIYDINNGIFNNVNPYDVKTLKYSISGKQDRIKGINIDKNKLRFNILFIDDKFIHQLKYQNNNNSMTTNIKMLKSKHLDKLENLIKNNNLNDFLIIDNL
jgi:hypothetical protein